MDEMKSEIILALEQKVKHLQDVLKSRDQEVKSALDDLRIVILALGASSPQLDIERPIPVEAKMQRDPSPKIVKEQIAKYMAPLKLMSESHSLMRGETHISLTTREYIIFEFMYKHRPESITREQLLSQFSNEIDMTERNIDVHIFSLRKKVDKVGIKIETVWRIGYRLLDDQTAQTPSL